MSRPKGFRNNPARHSLSARGIPNVKSFGHYVDTKTIQDWKLHIDKSDNTYPYRVQVENPEGQIVLKTLNFPTLDEAKEVRDEVEEDMKVKVFGRKEYLDKIQTTLEGRGFTVEVKPDSDVKEWNDPKMIVEKDGITIKLNNQDLDHEDYYVAIYKYFDTIKKITDELSAGGRDDVWYSDVSRAIKYEMKYAKSEYTDLVYSAVCDNLRKRGVNVHS